MRDAVPFTYASRICKRFAELGAIVCMNFAGVLTEAAGCRGVSLLFSSGDGGVGDGNPDPETQQCRTNDDNHTRRYVFRVSAPSPVGS